MPSTSPVVARLEALTGSPIRDLRPAGAQHGTHHYRATLATGREIFAKLAPVSPVTRGGPG